MRVFCQEEGLALRLEDKQAMVTEVQAVAHTAHSVVAAEYRGLTVTQITGLRAKARQAGVYMRVVKNTLARRRSPVRRTSASRATSRGR